MRAKKPVLLYCADPDLLAVTAYALRLHPYDVAAVRNSTDAAIMAGENDTAFACGVLIHTQQGDPAGRLVHRLLQSASHIPLLLVDRAGDLAPVRYADMVLYGRNTTMAHILAALEVLCQRSSGSSAQRIV
jgi:hypothetical protein